MINPMNFEFDPGKNELNKAKHGGLSFEEAQKLWQVQGVEVDLGIVNREFRYARMAPINGVVHLAVFTYRHGPAIRLISFRPATANEIKIYEEAIKKKTR